MRAYAKPNRREAAKVARMRAAVEELKPILTTYARAHGGRYILFGSAARGDLLLQSDVDILVDFPIEAELNAWQFAESQCFERGLTPDIQIRAWRKNDFVERAEREGLALQ
jgi:predicted nucleotidyltransferase